MVDYNSLKVPELKKLLGDRSLQVSGNKADLIARLLEADKKSAGGPAGDDEIDWDEDDSRAAAAPALNAGGQGAVATPAAVHNQKKETDSSKTTDTKVEAGEPATKVASKPATATAPLSEAITEPAPATVDSAPKVDFSIGIQQTDTEKEVERRAARAKRFGLTEDADAKKLAERSKKFGTDSQVVVKGLDDALPERRKRGREEKEKPVGRGAKRQTPDRRTEAPAAKTAAAPAKKPLGRILDDPAEKAKAEARAKRFQT